MRIKIRKTISPLFVVWLSLFFITFAMDWSTTAVGIGIVGVGAEGNDIIVKAIENKDIYTTSVFFAAYITILILIGLLVFHMESLKTRRKVLGIPVSDIFQWLRVFMIFLLFTQPFEHIAGYNSWVSNWDYILYNYKYNI